MSTNTGSSLYRSVPRSKFTRYASKQPFYARTTKPMIAANGYATDTYVTLMTIPAGMVGVIDQIIINGVRTNTAANGSVSISIDGTNSLTFVMPGEVPALGAVGQPHQIKIPVNGKMVAGPGKTIRVKTSNAAGELIAAIGIKGYMLHEGEAGQLGFYAGQTSSSVPCNFAYTSGSLTAATRTAIVPAIAGYSIEINGIWATGSALNSAAAGDSVLLEFSDGGATNSRVLNIYNALLTTTAYHAHRTNFGATNMLVRGASGLNLSATASTNVASGKMQVVVWGRYVKDDETWQTNGVPGTTGNGGRYFWFFSEDATANALLNVFSSAAASNKVAVVRGYLSSAVGAVLSLSNVAVGDQTVPATTNFVHTAGSGISTGEDDIFVPARTTDNFGFGKGAAPGAIATLVWGELMPETALSSGYLGTGLAGPLYYGA